MGPSPLAQMKAVVTGASRGVGRAIALALAAEGASVCLVGRERQALEGVARTARQTSRQVLVHPADLTEDVEIHELAQRLQSAFGELDVLLNVAGVIAMGPHEQASIQDLDRQYRINLRAPYLLTQVLLPMLRKNEGQVVFLSSTVSMGARAGVGQYAATKDALKGVAESLREEENARGIRVLTVHLGRTATDMQRDVYEWEGRAYDPSSLIQPEDVASMVIAAIRLPRSAEVTDILMRPMKKP